MIRLGQDLVRAVRLHNPEIVWLEKPLLLLPQWIDAARAQAPTAVFACFQDDDPFGNRDSERVSWSHFVASIDRYDVHFVKREENLGEFQRHGAKLVQLFMHGSFPQLFYPRALNRDHDLVFVGTALDHRVAFIRELLGRERLPLRVYGNDWKRTAPYWLYRNRFRPPVEGEAYAEVLSRSKIALGFVSSSNRDQYSMRTFEIPSCGAMLLAERTDTHEQLFKEGVEAEFFGSVEECADKCRFYLASNGARERIARNGYERVSRADYTLREHMRLALASLHRLREHHA